MRDGIPLPIPPPEVTSICLIAWIAYFDKDWIAVAGVGLLYSSCWMAKRLQTQVFRGAAKEPTKPRWWDGAMEFPHPTEQSHSADILRRKYRRFVRKIYP
jgi:hypothetical protein